MSNSQPGVVDSELLKVKMFKLQLRSIKLIEFEKLLAALKWNMHFSGVAEPPGGFTSEHLREHFRTHRIFPLEHYGTFFCGDLALVVVTYMWRSGSVEGIVRSLKGRFGPDATVWIDILFNDQRTDSLAIECVRDSFPVYGTAKHHVFMVDVAIYPDFGADGRVVCEIKCSPFDRCWCVHEGGIRHFACKENPMLLATEFMLPKDSSAAIQIIGLLSEMASVESFDFFGGMRGLPDDVQAIKNTLVSPNFYQSIEVFNREVGSMLQSCLRQAQIAHQIPAPDPAFGAGSLGLEGFMSTHMSDLMDASSCSALFDLLRRNDVWSVEVLEELSEEDLREMGVAVGARRALSKALRRFQEQSRPLPQPPPTPPLSPHAPAGEVKRIPTRCAATLPGLGEMWCVGFSPDGRLLACGSAKGKVLLFGGGGCKELLDTLEEHTDGVCGVGWHPDGSLLISASNDSTLRVWKGPEYWQRVGTLRGHGGWVTGGVKCVAARGDGRVIASGSSDWTVKVWDGARFSTCVGTLTGHTGFVWSVAFSPDGSMIASGSGDQSVRLWAGEGYKDCLATLKGHAGWVWSVSFSGDGEVLASGSADNSIRVWGGDGLTTCLAILRGHDDSVRTVCFSVSGLLASGSDDKTVRVWGGERWTTCLAVLRGHRGFIYGLGWRGDGECLASASQDGTVRVWE